MIGVFDSGLGGLSIWQQVRAALPCESIVYYGDGANCPYGGRTEDEVTQLTMAGVEFLIEKKGAKLVVIACNTATATAIDAVRARWPGVPIVGMLPAIKPAALSTRTGVVAILGTERSLCSEKLRQYTEEFAAGVEVISAVGTGFVELVERDMEGTPEALGAVRAVVEPLVARGADMLVLGCTHYPFLADEIRRVIAGREVEIIDPAPAIARRVAQLLAEHKLAADDSHEPEYEFYTLAGGEYLQKMKRKTEVMR
ncbi:MAG: glutamate racemase [Rikenellaceae bacterium]|nr:glutamate racemase [Rikenellaceae bacterium]MCL2692055.1 glutamate racemase [Rikenellaceae bacterium]